MSSTSVEAKPADKKPGGLAGVSAGETAICSVEQGKLIYRGYEIHDLAEHASFEEVAHLLLVGHKPSPTELAEFNRELVAERPLPTAVTEYIRSMEPFLASGSAVPMDVVRTAVSLLGNLDPMSQNSSAQAELAKAKSLLAKIPTVIGQMQRVIEGKPLVDPQTGGDASLSHAANLLYQMTGERPSPEAEKVMDVSLILYAEHDYNASTFTGRVIAGTLSDMHGAITGAVAALKGPLHGGANEAAMDMLARMQADIDAGKAPNVEQWLDQQFQSKAKLMGFGHRVYKNGDHRAPILHKLGRAAAERRAKDGDASFVKLFDDGEALQRLMLEKKNIHPNVDFPCGMTYFTLGIPVPQYTPIFVASRVSGWAAHVMEQHANNRLIRPLSEYTGPAERSWSE